MLAASSDAIERMPDPTEGAEREEDVLGSCSGRRPRPRSLQAAGRPTDPCNSLLTILQPNRAAAPGKNKICFAYFKCFTYESWQGHLSKLFSDKVSNETVGGSHRRNPGRGACRGQGRRTGQPLARSPQGLPEGAMWDFSEGCWDHVLVS